MPEDLTALRKKRGTLKAQITRLKTVFDAEKTSQTPNLTKLELRLSKTEDVLEQINALKSKIDILIDQNDKRALESEETDHYNLEEYYFDTIASIRDYINAARASINDAGSAAGIAPIPPTPQHFNQLKVKLPTITLPQFEGDYGNWLYFRDTFNSLVHQNEDIPLIQKFHYLRLSLKGEAANVIGSLEVSDTNYDVAYKLLVDRFENKELLISNHVSALFNLQSIPKENHTALRKLVDETSKHLRALEALGEPVQHWNTLVTHLVSTKLDSYTRRSWEDQRAKENATTFDAMFGFLSQRCRLLETLQSPPQSNTDKKPRLKSFVSTSTRNQQCAICTQGHPIYTCPDFLNLSVPNRFSRIKSLQLCLNCLKPGHGVNNCQSRSCKRCNKKHNSLLHFEKPAIAVNQTAVESTSSQGEPEQIVTTINHSSQFKSNHVLLPTALIEIFDNRGNKYICRALLDSGSQSNFITSALHGKLNTSVTKIGISVVGINNSSSNITEKTVIKMSSRCTSYKTKIECLIVPTISNSLGHCQPKWNADIYIPQNIILADPEFRESNEIDILLGSSLFFELLCVGQVNLGKDKPILHKTLLGWVVAGSFSVNSSVQSHTRTHFSTASDTDVVDRNLTRFWELEEVPSNKPLSQQEQICEHHFEQTTRRDEHGRFIVSIPLKEPVILGDSLNAAIKRLEAMEVKFAKNPVIKEMYCDFMREYLSLGHMSLIENPEFDHYFYLPHHCVLKDSLTTKLRVVFDASNKTSNGKSLNDFQLVGPVLQDDLFAILLRFRKHNYVISADVEKMYRQVQIHPPQRDLQRIVWRFTPDDDISHYKLNTVTYGSSSASFLAVRSLQQTAHDNADQFPEASKIIVQDFYMDDLITGHDCRERLTELREQIDLILSQGCFSLRKWISNEESIISSIRGDSGSLDKLEICDGDPAKTLGMLWLPKSDQLSFQVKPTDHERAISKRTILSAIAQLFDPLGLLSPCIIIPKIIIQKLWRLNIDWDESLPLSLYSQWVQFRNQLSSLTDLKIPRHALLADHHLIELHGFCDASEMAYGACIYIRTVSNNGDFLVRLLCSKSRVAPAKTTTIPRLELCGAVLLARLMSKAAQALSSRYDSVTYWCDSKIVLAWIKTPSNLLKTFVANRTAEIQQLTLENNWQHVKSEHNPADLISRGVNPQDLLSCSLWWAGPAWLSQEVDVWPRQDSNVVTEIPEMKTTSCLTTIERSWNPDCNFIKDFSSYFRLRRVIAYCFRFAFNALKRGNHFTSGSLSTRELRFAEMTLTKMVQAEAFRQDISDLRNVGRVNERSKLLPLSPFLDDHGVMRVGGRLRKSAFSFDKKHPAIIPTYHHLSILLARFEHIKLLHAVPQSTLYALRERFWPVSGRNLVKKITRECKTCFRFQSRPVEYLMADLPKSRVTPSRAFIVSGVDYGGPYFIKDRFTRNYKKIKAYICLFVCFSTRAVHIELVSDLTTDAFLAAFRRFMSRRGKCQKLYSDNATNFQGADSELARFVQNSGSQFETALAEEGVTWCFIPPRSPHFGGLWEAGIRSTKHHLKRIVGDVTLTYEQFYTVLVQIEACLNSRPLQPLSLDPHDPVALTPAHFLIGESLVSLPEPDLKEIPQNRLSQFQGLQRMFQHFWTRWAKEYVSELQTRVKWKKNFPDLLKVGELVLIKEDNTPPLKWALGRVTQLFPGDDGIVRVAAVKTACGVYKRPVSKLCVLSAAGDNGSV